MSIDGLDEEQKKILEKSNVPESLVETIDGWIRAAWSEGCSACQDDYYGVDVD